jgi:hypothetical protein
VEVKNTPAYYQKEIIKTVKSFIVQAREYFTVADVYNLVYNFGKGWELTQIGALAWVGYKHTIKS